MTTERIHSNIEKGKKNEKLRDVGYDEVQVRSARRMLGSGPS